MKPKRGDFLLVDGYNIIFAWDELNELSKTNLAEARDRLIHILADYKGYSKTEVILVFDAHKTKGFGYAEKVMGIDVVYTMTAETADAYIERTAANLTREYRVAVATSDRLEQIIILGLGALRMSAREFIKLMQSSEKSVTTHVESMAPIKKNLFSDNLDPETAAFLDKLRKS